MRYICDHAGKKLCDRQCYHAKAHDADLCGSTMWGACALADPLPCFPCAGRATANYIRTRCVPVRPRKRAKALRGER